MKASDRGDIVFNKNRNLFRSQIIFLLPTNFTNLHDRVLRFNGDLLGRTNHTNVIIELVKIRATVQVAF